MRATVSFAGMKLDTYKLSYNLCIELQRYSLLIHYYLKSLTSVIVGHGILSLFNEISRAIASH